MLMQVEEKRTVRHSSVCKIIKSFDRVMRKLFPSMGGSLTTFSQISDDFHLTQGAVMIWFAL